MAKSSVAEFFAGLKKFDFNNDIGNLGVWPPAVRVLMLSLIVVAALFGTYMLQIKDKQAELEQAVQNEEQKKGILQVKAGRAANLEEYKRQMAEVEAKFEELKRRLPTEAELSDLNNSLNRSARQTGVELLRQTFGTPVPRDEFFEQPLNLSLRGTFHEIGNFISAVARDQRIVTLHDFNITSEGVNGNEEQLRVTIQAKTYRYKESGQ